MEIASLLCFWCGGLHNALELESLTSSSCSPSDRHSCLGYPNLVLNSARRRRAQSRKFTGEGGKWDASRHLFYRALLSPRSYCNFIIIIIVLFTFSIENLKMQWFVGVFQPWLPGNVLHFLLIICHCLPTIQILEFCLFVFIQLKTPTLRNIWVFMIGRFHLILLICTEL